MRNVVIDTQNVLSPFNVVAPAAFYEMDFGVVFEGENVGTDSVEEVAVVADYQNYACKLVDCFFQTFLFCSAELKLNHEQ